MASTSYTYSIATNFPNHTVNSDQLIVEIDASAIITALDYVATAGDVCSIWFKATLSSGDQAILNAVVAAHTGVASAASLSVASAAISDGVNGVAAIKQANVPPAANDTSLVVAINPNSVYLSGDNRIGISTDNPIFIDPIDGSTINSINWTTSLSGMTIVQASDALTLNNSSVLSSNKYAVISSNRFFNIYSEFSLHLKFRVKLIFPSTNTTTEFGIGNVSGKTAPTDGVFFRVTSAGALVGVINYNGTETTTATLLTVNQSNFYNYHIRLIGDAAQFEITGSDNVALVLSTLNIPSTQNSLVNTRHLPIYLRTYTAESAAASAAQLILSYVSVQQRDLNVNNSWARQLVGLGKHSNINPITFAQTANTAASYFPSIVTPNATSIAFNGLGGEFLIGATAASANCLGVLGYQVPSPYSLVVTGIYMPPTWVNTTMGTSTVTITQWFVMVASSSNPSTATGQVYPLGMFSVAATATSGTVFNGQPISRQYDAPIIVPPGYYLIFMVKIASGPSTPAGGIRGMIEVSGYYE